MEGTGDGGGRVQLVQSSGGISQQLESGVCGRWEGVGCELLFFMREVFGKHQGGGSKGPTPSRHHT